MNNIQKVGKVVAKILEVFHWVGAALLAAASICLVAAPQRVDHFIDIDTVGTGSTELEVYGFEMLIPFTNNEPHIPTLLVFCIGAAIILAVMAMVFRNLNLIFKASTTSFTKDNIRKLKEIGIFAMAVPVIGLVVSTIGRLILGVDAVTISVSMSGLLMGILVLSLTQFFIHGAKLEEDVEGLV